MSDVDNRPGWVGQRAVAWVIDEAPVPASLFPVLMVIARRCDEKGRGSYQSAPTIAAKAGKSEDQVKRDIRELKKLGLLTPGDPALVAHIEVWKRPAVYDIPLHVSGPKPLKESRNKTGGKGQGGCMDTPPGMDAPGGMDGRGRGGMDAPGGGGMDAPQRKPLNKTSEKPSSLSPREDDGDTSPPVQPEPEREIVDASQEQPEPRNPIARLLIKNGCPAHLTDDVRDRLAVVYDIRSDGWFYTADRNGSLGPAVGAALEDLDTTPASGCNVCNDTGTAGDWMNARPCDCLWWKDPGAARKAFVAKLSGFPECEHGVAGGDLKAPTGWQHCSLCRGPGWVDKNSQGRTDDKGGSFKRSTSVLRAEQALAVADNLDRQFGHGKYAPGQIRSPADQRVADNQSLYDHYKRLEESA